MYFLYLGIWRPQGGWSSLYYSMLKEKVVPKSQSSLLFFSMVIVELLSKFG